MRRLIKSVLNAAGLALFRTRGRYNSDGLFTVHSPHFRDGAAFQAAYARGLQASRGVDPHFEWRVHVALWAASTALRAAGDFVECGVNAGFLSSAILQRLDWRSSGRRFFLIDTFQGPVAAQYSQQEIDQGRLRLAEQSLAAGAYVTDIERVRANFAEWPAAVVVQGAVPEVLPTLNISEVAFLHIDLNCAAPERAALEYFWDRLTPGAVVLLDDYGYLGQDCQRQAIDSAAESLGFEVLSLPTGQGLILKSA